MEEEGGGLAEFVCGATERGVEEVCWCKARAISLTAEGECLTPGIRVEDRENFAVL